MPTYEYRCEKCALEFSRMESMAEHETGSRPNCPDCGSDEVAQKISLFSAQTSKKS